MGRNGDWALRFDWTTDDRNWHSLKLAAARIMLQAS
jgi:hypothetical protein